MPDIGGISNRYLVHFIFDGVIPGQYLKVNKYKTIPSNKTASNVCVSQIKFSKGGGEILKEGSCSNEKICRVPIRTNLSLRKILEILHNFTPRL